MKFAFVFSTFFVPLLASAILAADEQEDAKKMEGSWVPVAAEFGGQKLPDEALKMMQLVLKGNEYTTKVGEVTDQGTVSLSPDKKPAEMDIVGTAGPNKGKTIQAIYQLMKDKLIVCYDLSGKERPKEFQAPAGTQLFLVTYQRK
jgi:uncharacterized protein (TIGR03067 family)